MAQAVSEMWQASVEPVSDGRVAKYRVLQGKQPVPYAQVLRLWENDEAFRTFFTATLAGSPFKAFRWETPPITAKTAERDFEFILLDSPYLDGNADSHAFSSHFAASADQDVLVFPNLGGDALMVVPCPQDPVSAYPHLAAFLRHGPQTQIQNLWRQVGYTMDQHLSAEPVWLNTAGMGVAWLHVRLDSWPKYYGYEPYKTALP